MTSAAPGVLNEEWLATNWPTRGVQHRRRLQWKCGKWNAEEKLTKASSKTSRKYGHKRGGSLRSRGVHASLLTHDTKSSHKGSLSPLSLSLPPPPPIPPSLCFVRVLAAVHEAHPFWKSNVFISIFFFHAIDTERLTQPCALFPLFSGAACM